MAQQPPGEDDVQYADDEGTGASTWTELPSERDFFASPYDPPIKALVQEMRDNELIVRPTFQRNQVWDATRKSRFVESILLNIPIPTLFFAEDEDKKVVVDGQQRLHAAAHALPNHTVPSPNDVKRWVAITFRLVREIEHYLATAIT